MFGVPSAMLKKKGVKHSPANPIFVLPSRPYAYPLLPHGQQRYMVACLAQLPPPVPISTTRPPVALHSPIYQLDVCPSCLTGQGTIEMNPFCLEMMSDSQGELRSFWLK